MDSKKLSLVAQYDDLIRFSETLISENSELEEKVKLLLENCEKQRRLWLTERTELNESRESHKKDVNKIKSLETTLKNVRAAFKKELDLREKIQVERDDLIKKLNQVKEYLIDEDKNSSKDSRTSLKETILSSLNLHKLTTVIEENTQSDKSLSDIDYSKSDDNILLDDNEMYVDNQIKQNVDVPAILVFENEDDFSIIHGDETFLQSDERIIATVKRTPSTKSKASVGSRMSEFSQNIMRQRQSTLPNELKVDNRPHQLVTKKIFKPEKCCVCATNLKFCSTGYHCRDCKAICHVDCKSKVPLPCIPYVSRANIGKQGRLILISDYVPSNCKPCVPALIVHCLSEIERREDGLKEVGVYRIPASESQVKELKEQILKSKHGIPQLTDKDVHVLCNVVKKFLNQLDEALVSRIAWRDFVEAVAEVDLNERQSRMKEAILNLPNANRDTLAYMMLHLRRVAAEEKHNKMSILAISKLFGPTILGYSIKDPPSMQIFQECKKQQQVVECLLNLDDEFWQSILNLDTNQLNFSIAKEAIYLSPEQQKTPSSRVSIGGRLCGGKVNCGTITPLKNKKSSRNFTMKPLF